MTRHGKSSSGRTRWRCRGCNISQVGKIDATAKHLDEFLGWLLSRDRQAGMVGQGRSFRRRTSQFWQLWPMPPRVDESYDVVFVDGIHLGRKAVVLIARTEKFVLGWYLARTEHTRAWEALLERICPPKVVISDGGSGLASALRHQWPNTLVQRCLFHVFNQVKTCTTTRPRLPAGQQLYALAIRLVRIKTLDQATGWLTDYNQWCTRWAQFLAEKTLVDGRMVYTHQPLVKARGSLNTLIRAGTLFTFLDPTNQHPSVRIPATNNLIEGGTNTRLRAMLRDHRGMSLIRRIKAIFWWCYTHTQNPLPAAQILKVMPTDAQIESYYRTLTHQQQTQATIPGWGEAISWAELHHTTAWHTNWD